MRCFSRLYVHLACRRGRSIAVVATLFLGALLDARLAFAGDVAFDGAWGMTAVTEVFTVKHWAAPCGPAPTSGTMLPAAAVTLRSDQGEVAVFAGSGRTLRTDLCLDAMPTLARDTHVHEARGWRTRCVTPPGDSRHAIVNTAFFVAPGDDAISIAETGRYEFAIGGERCIADVKRSGSLSRMIGVPTQVKSVGGSADKTAAPTPKIDCSVPGAPVRLEVRPSRKLLRLGENFAFRGVVVDANFCPAGVPIAWSLGPVVFRDGKAHSGGPTIDPMGRLTVPTAGFAEATFDVVATVGGRTARATVEATSAANFDALLAQSGLDPRGESAEAAVAILATSSIGAERAHAEDGASRRRTMFVSVVAVLALGLGGVAFVGAQRSRRARRAERAAEDRHGEKMREYERLKREREQQHAAQMKAHVQSVALAQQQAAAAAARGLASGPSFCPSCRREFAAGVAFCPFDANRLVAIAGHEHLLDGPLGGICPTCKRGFNPGVKVCPHDGEELLPPVVAEVNAGASSPPVRGKICPTCGARFDGVSAFCAKDGTQLVLLN